MSTILPIKKPTRRRVETFTLDATQGGDMEVFLEYTPSDPSSVVLDIVSGTVQVLGSDYGVDGDRVYWSGLALETVLAQNDTIIIIYT
jgi:hypothetical protein